jgi:type VI secretion system protein ImpF
MAEPSPGDRLLPCLLDRVTDEEPQRTQESSDRRAVSMQRYRQGVRRDLEDLLNASSRTESDSITLFEHVRTSVLNFGTPDLCGQTLSGLDEGGLERAVRDAILHYEPRILSQSLSVQVVRVAGGAPGRSSLALEITGELWATPTPDPLFFRTEVDLETGQFTIKDRSHG